MAPGSQIMSLFPDNAQIITSAQGRGVRQHCPGKGCWNSMPDTKLGWFSCSSPTILFFFSGKKTNFFPTILLLLEIQFPAKFPQFCCSFPLKQAGTQMGEEKSLCISEGYEIIRWHFPSSPLITRRSSHKELVCAEPSANLRSRRREAAELQIMTF